MQGDITGLYDIGCVVGSIVCYFVGEKYGRRTMLLTGATIMVIGSALLASSYSIAQLLVGRIVTGFGNGMNSSTAPVFQSECSPASYRGALLTLQGTVTILGVVIAYWYSDLLSDIGRLLTYCSLPGSITAPASTPPPSNGASRSLSRPSSPFASFYRSSVSPKLRVGWSNTTDMKKPAPSSPPSKTLTSTIQL